MATIRHQILPPLPKISAEDILDIIEATHCRRPGAAVLLREFPLEPGTRGRASYRIDGLLVQLRKTYTYNRTAFEVKIDRRDFESELRNPEKRKRAMALSDRFYFAVPHGLVQADEVPSDCGLLWIHPELYDIRVIRSAEVHPKPAPEWPEIRDLMRRAYAQGLQDAAKQTNLASWPEVIDVACVLAELSPLLADLDGIIEETDTVLQRLQKELYRHGRKREAREISELRRHTNQEAESFKTELNNLG